jgi:hypothetical protein
MTGKNNQIPLLRFRKASAKQSLESMYRFSGKRGVGFNELKHKVMAINNVKHIIGEIDGIRCTIIESDASLDRVAFLSDLLGFNNLEVKEMKEVKEVPEEEQKFTIGVTDLVFNPVFAIYERQLKNREGTFVTPGYWKQECTECDPRYWIRRKATTT